MNSNREHKLPITEQPGALQDGLWDIRDLSGYLKVKIKTVYAMVPYIPHYRIGKLIRFQKAAIDNWLESKRKNNQEDLQNRKPRESTNIDLLIRKTIDRAKQEDYNSHHGKSDRIKTQQKEMDDGSI